VLVKNLKSDIIDDICSFAICKYAHDERMWVDELTKCLIFLKYDIYRMDEMNTEWK
jgi:hypothetical protein